MGSFEGQHAVVTGGTGALGSAVVAALEAEGASCHVPRRPEVDVTSESDVVAYYRGLERVDVSIHVVGGFDMGPFVDTSLDAFRNMLDLNLVSAFLACREAAKKMEGRGGRIVNVASKSAVLPEAGTIAYATSKAAVVALTERIAVELDDVRVNAVLPGTIDTPANREAMPDADFGAWVQVEEIAAAILFLARPENTATTGTAVRLFGGA